MRVALIANSEKPDALAAARELRELISTDAHVELIQDEHRGALLNFAPELIVVLGGDGTILQMSREVYGIPAAVVGVNFGKLGYLAAFSLEQFKHRWKHILEGRLPVSERLMLHGAIYQGNEEAMRSHSPSLPGSPLGQPVFDAVALNDVVINAGEPFRMVELHVRINRQETTTFRSDGMIVSTSSGSTGYNLSAGGPLIAPEVDAMVLTPICPHSLSFRPVVVSDKSTILIHPHRVNVGTAVVFDGQVSRTLHEDEFVVIRRAEKPLRLVENPEMSHWDMLGHKLHWARSPRQ